MALAIVIPVLNDSAALESLLGKLRASSSNGAEILVVDGGSSDNSRDVALQGGAKLLTAPRGRAHQLSRGAAETTGEWIWFLHADSSVSADVLAALERIVTTGSPAWGRFDVRLSGVDRRLRVVEALMNARSRLSGIATGDQGIFVHRSLLAAVGGVPNLDLMEDVELSRRLKRLCRPVCLRERIVTSSRRWERDGVVRTILLMWRIRLLYALGADAARLHRMYYGVAEGDRQ